MSERAAIIVDEHRLSRFGLDDWSAEASDLGLLAGEWPERIIAKFDGLRVVEFQKSNPMVTMDRDLVGFRYDEIIFVVGGTLSGTRTLTLWND